MPLHVCVQIQPFNSLLILRPGLFNLGSNKKRKKNDQEAAPVEFQNFMPMFKLSSEMMDQSTSTADNQCCLFPDAPVLQVRIVNYDCFEGSIKDFYTHSSVYKCHGWEAY